MEKNSSINQTAVQDDHLSMKFQDRAYNDAYKRWRRRKRDSGGFYFVSNPNELTYRDGFGFIKAYPEAAETDALRRIFKVIGTALLAYVLADIIYTYCVPYFMNKFGVDIYFDFYADKLYGNSWLIFAMNIIFEISKRVLVFFYCYKKLQLPTKVMTPCKITNIPVFKAAFPVMLLISVVCMVMSLVYNYVLGAAYIVQLDWIKLPSGLVPGIMTVLIDVLLLSAMNEIFMRGFVLQLLRQFGDGSAIFVSAFISACCAYNINSFCYIFVTTLVIGYFTIRTGSIITAIIMRATSRAFVYGIYILNVYCSETDYYRAVLIILLAAVLVGMPAFINIIVKHGDKFNISMHPRYLSFSHKMTLALGCPQVSFWLAASFILALMHINFRL